MAAPRSTARRAGRCQVQSNWLHSKYHTTCSICSSRPMKLVV